MYDAVVIGTGSGGKLAAIELARQGRSVLAVEAGRFGGECPYVACVPAKSMLLSARSGWSWADAVARRDRLTDARDDAASQQSLTDAGVETTRGRGRLDGRDGGAHRVVIESAGGRERVETARVVVLAPGSSPTRPPVDGLDSVPTWTSDDALSADEQPGRLLVLGGGAVGCELAQAFAQLGTEVSLIEVADRVLPAEVAWVGEMVAEALQDNGVNVRAGAKTDRVEVIDGGRVVRLHLTDVDVVEADRLLVAGGRSANTAGLGLATVDVEPLDSGAVPVDARCRVVAGDGTPVPGLYAVGDVTEASSYTHSANYQARIVADDVAGRGHDADYSAIPRAVYLDPAVFCVGLTADQAAERGRAVRTAAYDVGEVERAALVRTAVRPSGRQPGRWAGRGRVELVADAASGVLVGAACVGPEADAWGAELALAVRARIDVQLLAEHVRAFPTWSEAVSLAAAELAHG